jgi:hypothetical protein
MNTKEIESSVLSKISYDDATQELHVDFKNGSSYIHHGVAPHQAQAFFDAPSYGKHYNKHISGKFRHTRKKP